ncbi:hypothetical protein F7725_003315, partial [Dissostichus mawsoni]
MVQNELSSSGWERKCFPPPFSFPSPAPALSANRSWSSASRGSVLPCVPVELNFCMSYAKTFTKVQSYFSTVHSKAFIYSENTQGTAQHCQTSKRPYHMHTLSSGSNHTHCSGAQQRKLRTCTVAQAALRSAVGLTMPQTTQHSLIHVLLLWITILSIVQVVFITLFFTTGHHSRALSSSTVTPAMQVQANITPSAPSELMGKVEMLTFKATKANRKITLVTKNQDQILVSEEEDGTVLKIKKDGYFLLNLQVTLSSCNHTLGSPYEVSLTSKDTVILWGRINTSTCSTGLLGKVEELNANDSLEVTIEPPNDYDMKDDESLNHLD